MVTRHFKKNQSAGWLTAILGGNWTNGTNGGGFNWNLNHSSANRNRNHGARLVHARNNQKRIFALPWLLPKHIKLNQAVLVG